MIAGWYDGNGRPTLKAMVIIEPIGVECVVDFLVDTGADLTCLHYPDVAVAGVDHGLLEEVSRPASMRGVGGSAEYRVVTSDVILDDFGYRPGLLPHAAADSGGGAVWKTGTSIASRQRSVGPAHDALRSPAGSPRAEGIAADQCGARPRRGQARASFVERYLAGNTAKTRSYTEHVGRGSPA